MATTRTLKAGNLQRYREDLTALKTAFDLLSDHVIITDSDAHLLYANKAAEETTGFTLSEMLGKNPGDLWGGNMPKEVWEKAWNTMKTEKKPVVLDVRNTRKDGIEVWQSLHISPVLDEHENIKLFIGIEPNITEQKQKERFRENFLSTLSHKTPGPLTGIQWIVEVLCERGKLPKKYQDQLRALYSESKTLTSLLSDLTLLSRMGKGYPLMEDVDLSLLLSDVMKTASNQYANHFSYTLPAEPFLVRTDPALARELLLAICESFAQQPVPDKEIVVSLHKEKSKFLLSFAGKNPVIATDRTLSFAMLIARHLKWTLNMSSDKERTITIRILQRA